MEEKIGLWRKQCHFTNSSKGMCNLLQLLQVDERPGWYLALVGTPAAQLSILQNRVDQQSRIDNTKTSTSRSDLMQRKEEVFISMDTEHRGIHPVEYYTPQGKHNCSCQKAHEIHRRFEHTSSIGSMLRYRGSKTDIPSAYCWRWYIITACRHKNTHKM